MSREAGFLLSVVSALLGLGLVVLFSATAAPSEVIREDAFFFLKRQLLWLLLGTAAMILASRVPLRWWESARVALLLGTFLALGLVFLPGIGEELNGARRWIRLGGWTFQPSEMAKVTLPVFLCAYAARDADRIRSFLRGFLPTCAILGAACTLIALERDVGTALFLGSVLGTTLLVGGVRFAHLLPAAGAAAPAAAVLLYAHMAHVRARFETWLNPDLDPLGKGHQIKQSLIALGSGGLWGEGVGRGTQKLFFLPEAHSDFLFPILGEEMGFVGAAGVVLLYVLVGVAGWRIGRRASSRFAFLLSFALTANIMIQAAINIAVATAVIPAKGIPLPFMSHGGSAMLFALVGVGILWRIADEGERVEGSET